MLFMGAKGEKSCEKMKFSHECFGDIAKYYNFAPVKISGNSSVGRA